MCGRISMKEGKRLSYLALYVTFTMHFFRGGSVALVAGR